MQKHNIAIKTALLSQNIIIGLGNIYSDEVLFKSKIHPLRKISTLNQAELHKLFRYIPIILNQAIKAGGTTFATYRTPDGKTGSYVNSLNVYGRKNQPCKFCQYTLQSTKINGRSTYFCKNCQK
ncbi:MAG: zinc finger domain-containing protein [Candidatus Paceibacterota bacterium]